MKVDLNADIFAVWGRLARKDNPLGWFPRKHRPLRVTKLCLLDKPETGADAVWLDMGNYYPRPSAKQGCKL